MGGGGSDSYTGFLDGWIGSGFFLSDQDTGKTHPNPQVLGGGTGSSHHCSLNSSAVVFVGLQHEIQAIRIQNNAQEEILMDWDKKVHFCGFHFNVNNLWCEPPRPNTIRRFLTAKCSTKNYFGSLHVCMSVCLPCCYLLKKISYLKICDLTQYFLLRMPL